MCRRVKGSAISSFISLISTRNQWQAAGCKMCGQHIHCLPKNMIFLETPNAKPSIWTYTYFTNLAGWNFWRASPYTKHNSHPFIHICISQWHQPVKSLWFQPSLSQFRQSNIPTCRWMSCLTWSIGDFHWHHVLQQSYELAYRHVN